MSHKLVLASTSSYRRSLLQQLGLDFEQVDPGINENELPGEQAGLRALRLARRKAVNASAFYAADEPCIIIGSDQVAHLGVDILPKPGTFDRAFDQLRRSSGKWVSFSTAICLSDSKGQVLAENLDIFEIRYRKLKDAEISHYLQIEQPYDCAGSIKAESRGIALIEDSRGKDINTLYGLPKIMLVDLLASVGFNTLLNAR